MYILRIHSKTIQDWIVDYTRIFPFIELFRSHRTFHRTQVARRIMFVDPESSIVRISFEFYREKLGRFEEKLKHEGEVFRERVHLRFTTDPCFDNYSRSFSQWDRYNRSNANARWKSKKGVFELTMLHNFRTQFVKFNRLLNANLSFNE